MRIKFDVNTKYIFLKLKQKATHIRGDDAPVVRLQNHNAMATLSLANTRGSSNQFVLINYVVDCVVRSDELASINCARIMLHMARDFFLYVMFCSYVYRII